MSVIDSLSLGGTTYSLRDNDGRAIIAGTESSTTSAHAYSAGDYFILNDTLYEATAAIAVGGTITVGTNCQATTVCGEVGQLKSDLSVYEEYFVGVVNPINGISWTDGKAISANGSITDNGSFHYSSLVPIESGIYTFVWEAVGVSNTIRIHGYDSNGTWIQQIDTFASGVSGVQTRTLAEIPSTVTQLRLSIGKQHKPLALCIGSTIQAQVTKASRMHDLIICGYDATPYQKAIGEAMALQGYGYVCDSTELDSGINTFIDSFMNTERTIYFFGTIRTSEGIHKHPKHNLVGYDCVLKMGDNLGDEYISCIRPTSGGVPFSTANQVISHNNTFVKGFTFDGNCENNKEGDVYKAHPIYGATICGEWYHNESYPYDQTQSMSDIVLEDIKAIETMRGIIVGIGWKCRNLYIGRAVTDHALYLAGADGAIVDNCYCTGRHLNGAIAISGQSWIADRKVKNIHLKNITLDECNGINGSLLDIRGHFSTWGNNRTLDDVFIDGLFINKRKNFQENVAITIGTHASGEHGDYTLEDYPANIHINNLVADIKLYNSFMRISNARVNIENSVIRVTNYRYDRGLFQLQSRDIIKKAFDLSGFTIISETTEDAEHSWTIFAIDNGYESHKYIHGLNLDDLYIEGFSNYYLFHVTDVVNTTYVRINDVSSERIVATPLGTVNPASDRILFVTDDYYQLET